MSRTGAGLRLRSIRSGSIRVEPARGIPVKPEERFLWLDLIRGLSAVAVCAGHLRATVFIDFVDLKTSSVFNKAFYLLTGLGHQAVMVFFVLSGFFVGGSILRKRTDFKWREYAVARLSRLWTVLIPALAVTFLIDRLIGLYVPEVLSGTYLQLWTSGPVSSASYSTSPSTFLGNVFFLQSIATPVFGTNSPLWSLANEFWYYVIFPLCAYTAGQCFSGSKPKPSSRLAAGLLAAALFALLPREMKLGFGVWCLGLVVFMTATHWANIAKWLLLPGLLTFVGGLGYSKSATFQAKLGMPGDVAVGLGFCVLCCALASFPAAREWPRFAVKSVRWLSNISYSLYLVHFPFVMLIASLFYKSHQLSPDILGYSHFSAWFGLLLFLGTLFWFAFERRTNEIRGWVMDRLAMRTAKNRDLKQNGSLG